MFPLTSRTLIRGAKEHVAAGLGIAADYQAFYAPLFAPCAGRCDIAYGSNLTYRVNQGGKWLRVTRPNGDRIEFAHLSKFEKTGPVAAEDRIGTTGNTGRVTSGPHLHVQIFNRFGERLDPEKYDWSDHPLLYRVNEIFREEFKKEPSVSESGYWQKRVVTDAFAEPALREKMAYWRSLGKTRGQREQ